MKKKNMQSTYLTFRDVPSPAPRGTRLRDITFDTCPGSHLVMRAVRDVAGPPPPDGDGMTDTWWVILTPDLPDRAIRVRDGLESLGDLLRRYGFADSSGCLHHRSGTVLYRPLHEPLPAYDLERIVPQGLASAVGVPQFYVNSGVCWFASLCTCFFASPRSLRFLKQWMPAEMYALAERALFDRDAAEALRKMWWFDYQVGDDTTLPPEMDGRNGIAEWTTLCGKLGVPLVRYEQYGDRLELMGATVRDRRNGRVQLRDPPAGVQHYLVLRYVDAEHTSKHPVLRWLRIGCDDYTLVGVVSGNRRCGHQIGWAVSDDDGTCTHLTVGDADVHKGRNGLLHVRFSRCSEHAEWWKGCRDMIHVTKFGPAQQKLCSLSPWNLPEGETSSKTHGTLCVDVVYLSNPQR